MAAVTICSDFYRFPAEFITYVDITGITMMPRGQERDWSTLGVGS